MSTQTQLRLAHPMATPVSGTALLQRKCACGGSSGSTGACAECRRKRLIGDGSLALQPKLMISEPGDRFEQEADRVAEQVMRGAPGVMRPASELALQRSTLPDSTPTEVPASVHEVLRSPGQPLPDATRVFFEPRLGYDFSRVRVHTDAKATESAREVGALAYTVGNNVVFGRGQLSFGSDAGRGLLAHELTHVVQQTPLARPPSMPLEGTLADRKADPAALPKGESLAHPRPTASLALQRQAELGGDGESQNAPVETEGGLGEAIEDFVNRLRCAIGNQVDPVVNPMADISTFQSPGASGWFGAKFGCFRNSCTRRHRGWDLHAPAGTPVQAVVSGRMTRHNDPGGYGQFVRLTSGADPQRRYVYAHLSVREPAGDYCPGDKLGETGTTGNASADRPHLHFEVQTGGTAVDPDGFLTEPNQVIEATGSTAAAIDKTLPPACESC